MSKKSKKIFALILYLIGLGFKALTDIFSTGGVRLLIIGVLILVPFALFGIPEYLSKKGFTTLALIYAFSYNYY